ncbi:hypothetical protein IV203_011970 [Nitzschia inconspicua]|uniref:Uncharacterized protein n=1 Tax=Nitzschia inconspicua TaxID=303405 RepID=A0A9K3KSY9_9STRA|nr:hypothetical protein IV203_011970 [Nitzschia inconspicua]
MAETPNQPDAVRFDRKDYDVTCCCEKLCCGSTLLILGEEEAELKGTCCCNICTSNKRGPYGELGTVDSETCCCFYGFRAGSLMPNPESGAQCTGCGCQQEKVDAIVAELKKRQAMRGDRAKVRLAETTVNSLNELHAKVDLIMQHLQIEAATIETMQR